MGIGKGKLINCFLFPFIGTAWGLVIYVLMICLAQAMVRQVKHFTQRRLGEALRLRNLPVDMGALLMAVKVAFLELEQVKILIIYRLNTCHPHFSSH